MNSHGATYYLIRSIVRFVFSLFLVSSIVVGIPYAAHYGWPAVVAAGALWLLVIFLYRADKRKAASAVQ